jgi:hypothetical protein
VSGKTKGDGFIFMAINNNSIVSQEIREVFKIQGAEGLPQSVGNQIVPVIDVNPTDRGINKVVDATNTSPSSTGTIYTTLTTKKTFLMAAELSFCADAVNTSTEMAMSFYPKGKAISKIKIRKLSTVAAAQSIYCSFMPKGIELEPNTVIGAVIQDGANAVIQLSGIAFLREEDNPNA